MDKGSRIDGRHLTNGRATAAAALRAALWTMPPGLVASVLYASQYDPSRQSFACVYIVATILVQSMSLLSRRRGRGQAQAEERDVIGEPIAAIRAAARSALTIGEADAANVSAAVAQFQAGARGRAKLVVDVGEAIAKTARLAAEAARGFERFPQSAREWDARATEARGALAMAALATGRATRSVVSLTGRTRRIGDIAGLVEAIAAQTDLIAINASIEAARAGPAGAGFFEIARETKTLAEQTRRAAETIADHFAGISEAASAAGESVGAIAAAVAAAQTHTADLAAELARAPGLVDASRLSLESAAEADRAGERAGALIAAMDAGESEAATLASIAAAAATRAAEARAALDRTGA